MVRHVVNFSVENSKITSERQKWLNSWYLQTLITSKVFNKTWELYGEGPRVKHQEQLPVLDNKTIITEKNELLSRRKEHLSTLFNEPSSKEQYAVDKIEKRPTQYWIPKYTDLDEMSKVIYIVYDGNSAGADGHHLEINNRKDRGFVKVFFTIIKTFGKTLMSQEIERILK